MLQAMFNGISGLRAHKVMLDVIGNNIANINTTGYKSSRATFKDMLSQTISGASAPKSGGFGGMNPIQVGMGTSIASIDIDSTGGPLQQTGRTRDLGIQGNGFLMLSDGTSKYYTRDGALDTDSEGNLTSSSSGLKVLGWMADPATGLINSTSQVTSASSIKLPIGQMSVSRQTSQAVYSGNLNADSAVGATSSSGFQLYDSLGIEHPLNITFTKTANPGEWTWEAASPDASGSVGSGTISFDSSGKCTTPSGSAIFQLAVPNGSTNPVNLSLSFGSITQLKGDTTVNAAYQDGLPLGVLKDFTVSNDGTITGLFSNGMSQDLARISLAGFTNPSGLNKIGDNLMQETSNSGLAQVGQASTGGLGKLVSGSLESSNVDLPTEFANMIVAQRGFQANSRIITTSDEILQEIMQLKR